MDEQQAMVSGRAKGRPPMAGRGQRTAIMGLTLALVFSLGILVGIGLSYGTWVRPFSSPAAPPASEPATQPPTEPVTQPVSEPGLVAEPAVEEEATEPPATEPASSEPDGAVTGYILPNSSTEYLTWEDYGHLSLWELVLARNEIFARHGRLFHDPDIQAYFNSCSWYEGTVAPENFDTGVMSDIEVQNVWTLKAAEG